MVIPHGEFDPLILQAMIEEFITRDGAVHGHTDASIEEMTTAIQKQLETGLAEIIFDEENESWTIVRKSRH